MIRKDEKEKSQKKKEPFSTVTAVQFLLCAVLVVFVLITVKTGGEGAQRLQNDFSRLMAWSFENSDSESIIESVKQFISDPSQLMPAFSPFESWTQEAQGEESAEGTAEAEETTHSEQASGTAEEESAQSEGTTAEKEAQDESTTAEKAADGGAQAETTESTQTQPKPLSALQEKTDAGGEDIALYKAAENTSFSPVATTYAPVQPVDSTNYTSYFGYRINPITNARSFHTGLDIAAPQGTKVKAVFSATVRKTGEDSHSGKYVILTHSDGLETFYCHLSKILAEEGAVLRQGETIALVGSTGWSTGPHLHFEVRKNGERLNPLWVLEK